MFEFLKNRKSRKQLLQEIEDLKRENYKIKQEHFKEKLDLHCDFQKRMPVIATLSATCITHHRHDENTVEEMVKECLCNELMKQLLPYVKYESYPIAGEYGERKHYGSIQVIKPNTEETI